MSGRPTTTDALAVACPNCGSDPGIVCIDPDESIPFDVHPSRYEAAAARPHPDWERFGLIDAEPEEEPDAEVEIRFTFEDDAEAVAILERLIERIRSEGLRPNTGAWVVRDVNGNTVGDLTCETVPA